MIRITRVSTPPTKPTLVYDGDCGFCRIWIQRWRQITQDHVVYERFQDSAVRGRFSEIALSEFQASVQLIETDGSIYGGARAALGALSKNPRWLWLLNTYDRWPHFAEASENSYRFVATHRRWFSRLTRIAWGDTVEKPTQHLVRSLFLKALAVIYILPLLRWEHRSSGWLASKESCPPNNSWQASSNMSPQTA